MRAFPDARRMGGNGLTFAVATAAIALFGWVGALPLLVGPAVGIAGLVLSAWLRRSPRIGGPFGPWPVLLALGTLAVTAPAVTSAELFGGFATLAVLLWLADDPGRPAGGGRRAAVAVGSCALSVGVAWAVLLALPRPAGAVGAAGALLLVVLLAVAYLLVREGTPAGPAGANA